MLDYHLHLLPHGEDRPFRADDVRAYAGRAAERGVEEIAITEHLFRFEEAGSVLGRWWDDEPRRDLREQTERYWRAHCTRRLDEYVDAVTTAAGDPGDHGTVVRLGLEVDLYPGRMAEVAGLLAAYPFDVLLGSVHWIGGWGFDQYTDAVVAAEWARRSPADVWDRYVTGVEELAASGACDVLAHVDLAKVTGVHPPGDAPAWHDRLVKAAAAHGLCVEVSSAGWRKPVGEPYPAPSLLGAFCDAGVGATMASDAHDAATVADGAAGAAALLVAAGYTTLTAFRARRPEPRSL